MFAQEDLRFFQRRKGGNCAAARYAERGGGTGKAHIGRNFVRRKGKRIFAAGKTVEKRAGKTVACSGCVDNAYGRNCNPPFNRLIKVSAGGF